MEKINYDCLMEKIIMENRAKSRVPTLLLHTCCAPCSSAVIERLAQDFKITVFYYNPNIEPYEEYLKRKEEQKKFLKVFPSPNPLNFLDCDYENEEFRKLALGLEKEKEGGPRCFRCYRLRLLKTAQKAKELGFDYFTTSLSISPYKNAQKLNEIGLELEQVCGVPYLVSDFKKKDGYKKSILFSKEYNLYRQDYCGCVYSKKERDERVSQKD